MRYELIPEECEHSVVELFIIDGQEYARCQYCGLITGIWQPEEDRLYQHA